MSTAAITNELESAVQTDDGKWKIVLEVGGKSQTFIYENETDLNHQLIKAQKHATKLIGEQAERIKKLSPLEEREAWRDHCIAEGRKFRAQNPDLALYDAAGQMKIENLIYQALEEKYPDIFKKHQKENFTAEILGAIYMELGESESLPARPEAAPQPQSKKEPEGESPSQAAARENPPAAPARTFSTGVRNGTGTHAAPVTQKRKPAEVWAEIDAMSSDAYDRKLATDPAFRKLVDSLPAR